MLLALPAGAPVLFQKPMGDDLEKITPTDYVIESIKAEIESSSPSRRNRILEAIDDRENGNDVAILRGPGGVRIEVNV